MPLQPISSHEEHHKAERPKRAERKEPSSADVERERQAKREAEDKAVRREARKVDIQA